MSPTTYQPGFPTIEMVARALMGLAASAAFTAEVQDRWLLMTSQAPTLNLLDVNGVAWALPLVDNSVDGGATPDLWMASAFAEVRLEDVSDPESLSGSWPQLRVVPGRGRADGPDDGYGRGFRNWLVPYECAVLSSNDQPQLAQREALVLAEAFECLVRRNESLGGLVRDISAAGPIQPGGYGPVGQTMLAVAVVRFEARILKL